MRTDKTGQHTHLPQASPDGPRVGVAPRVADRSIRQILPFGLLTISLVTVYCAITAGRLDGAIVWGSVALATYIASLFMLLFSGSKSFGMYDARLGAWFLAFGTIAFGFATASITLPQTGAAALVNKSLIPAALLLVAISYTLWAIGYAVGRARVFQAPFKWGQSIVTSRLSQDVRSPGALLLVFALGLIADALTVSISGSYGYLGNSSITTSSDVSWYTQPLLILSGLKPIALFGLAVRVFITKRDKVMTFLVPTLLFALGLSLLTGMKETFVATMVSVAIPFFLGDVKWRLVSIAAAVLVFVFIVTPTITGFREDIRGGSGRLDVMSSLSLGVQKIFAFDEYLTRPGNSGDGSSTIARIRLIDNLTLIMDKTPDEIGFRPPGEIIAAPLTALVPRLFWADKPVRISGYDFYRSYYEGTSQSSSAITLQGSLFLYGGTWVLCLGMLLVGVIMRSVDDALDAKNNLHGALFFSVLVMIVAKQEMDVAQFLASVPILIIICALGALLIFRRARPRSQAAAAA